MQTSIAFEAAADVDLLGTAPDALLAIADVATLLGIKRLDRNFGTLGGELAALSEVLEKLDTTLPEDKCERRIRKLLKELARACSWHLKRPREDFPSLIDLVKPSRVHGHSKGDIEAERGLLAYALEGRLPRLITLVRGFAGRQYKDVAIKPLQASAAAPRHPGIVSKAISQTEYPKHVREQLYRTLCKYSNCQCSEDRSIHATAPTQKKTHLSRLRLEPSRDVKEESICFDMVFSSRPTFPPLVPRIEWQHMQFQVSNERPGKKRARFSNSEKSLSLLEQQPASTKEVQLCQHIKSESGSQICLRVHNDQVWLLEDCLPLEAHVLACPSLPLSAALQTGHLSNKMKVILAYIIAISAWEFYDSDWMSEPWSADDIHFLQEHPDEIDGQPFVSVNRPYLAVEWEKDQTSKGDISTVVGKIHRYPRVLSLGLMLIEIGTGKRARELFPNYQTNVNSDWLSAKEFLSKLNPWEDFDYRSYWDAARTCVNNHFFLRATSSVDGHMVPDIEGRRQMILDDVVTPLEDLLDGTGWMHDISTLGPMKPSPAQSVSNTHASLPKNGDISRSHTDLTSRRAIGSPRKAILEPAFENLSISEPSTPLYPRNRLGFEIAIICALPTEADAVISLFDEHWDEDSWRYGKARRDPNAYSTGRIGQHNVVVAHMPSMGKVNAASVAQGLHSSFENIRLAIVVGICGGVPYTRCSKQEIFLGDVVISRSLIQYDFGRQYPGEFEAKDSLQGGSGKPPGEIRSILAKLQTGHHRQQLELHTVQLLNDIQRTLRGSAYPGPEKDKLYASTSLHCHHMVGECHTCLSEGSTRICTHAFESSCEDLSCETSGIVRRTRLKNGPVPLGQLPVEAYPPSIHIGNMGSGDTVMKSGTHRDEIAQKYDIIGFEMEGAGIWDFFPSLIIKAVCDYADSHKNKDWQTYAAATAAAATKAFLKEWRSTSASCLE